MTTPTKEEVLAAIAKFRASEFDASALHNALVAAEAYIRAQEPEPEPVDPLEAAEYVLHGRGDGTYDEALAVIRDLLKHARGMELRPQITREMVREGLRACHWRTDDWAVETLHAALTAQVQHD